MSDVKYYEWKYLEENWSNTFWGEDEENILNSLMCKKKNGSTGT